MKVRTGSVFVGSAARKVAARRDRSARAVASVMTLVVLLGPGVEQVSAQQTVSGGCAGVTVSGRWERVALPSFPSGSPGAIEYSVDPSDPSRLLITDGRSVQLSSDGGCSWAVTFTAPDGASIVDLAFAPDVAILAIDDPASPRPRVVISGSGGQTWRETQDGLEGVVGKAIGVGLTYANPRYAHLLVSGKVAPDDLGPSIGYRILQSSTAGASWDDRGSNELSPSVAVPGGPTIGSDEEFTGLVPDPENAGRVYAFGRKGVVSYEPGARDSILSGDVTTFAAIRPPSVSTTTLLAALRGSRSIKLSSNAGNGFLEVAAPVAPDSFAEGLSGDEYFLAGSGKVFLSRSGRFVDISPSDGSAVTDLATARTTETMSLLQGRETLTLYGRTATTLERTTETRTFPLPGALQSTDLNLLPGEELPLEAPSLLPVDTSVSLMEGETKTVPYRFFMPATPTPLDVFFDVDVSSSMQEEIDGLRRSMAEIANQLTLAGVDAWFGAGQYRSYDNPPAFQRLRDIGPPGPELAAALNQMIAQGGGYETQLESLYQIVTGAGSSEGPGIAPNQDATWRDGSLRVIVNVTDEPISEGKPHPSYDRIAAALKADGALHFGIAVQDAATVKLYGEPLPGLMRISRESGSFAPAGGADCDGDGDLDLYQGEPLVCTVDPVRTSDAAVMGTAIINVLTAVSDLGTLRIDAEVRSQPPPTDPVALPSASVVSGIDFKKPTNLEFQVAYTCPSIDEETVYPIEIDVSRSTQTVVSGGAQLTCTPIPERPKPERPLIAFPAPLLPLLTLGPPPPRPPEPIQNPRPNPNPNPNPAQQSQAQGQGAAAVEQQRQPQLATVRAGRLEPRPARQAQDAEIRRDSLYLSASTPATNVPYLIFLGAAASIAVAAVRLKQSRERQPNLVRAES